MVTTSEIRFAPAVTAMREFLEPYRSWLEHAVGCSLGDTITFEIELPIGQIVLQELLPGIHLEPADKSLRALREEIRHWELPPDVSPRISLAPTRKRGASIIARKRAWRTDWRECPIAVYLKGQTSAFVVANVPVVYVRDVLSSEWRSWLIVNRACVDSVLSRLALLDRHRTRHLRVFHGELVELTSKYDWNSVVLDPSVARLVRDDFEVFFRREKWFRSHGLPFRRGYLLYGPPGNGKTTVVKVMAAHPAITAFTLDFCNEHTDNNTLSSLFDAASQNAPALVIFEDLDRAFATSSMGERRVQITLQHLLNCLDGVGTQDGIVVVATANNPSVLDPAILKRPGRFDRVVGFQLPSQELRTEYLRRISRGVLNAVALTQVALQAEGFSFAQLRETYILAGHLAFDDGCAVGSHHVSAAVGLLRGQNNEVGRVDETKRAGFSVA